MKYLLIKIFLKNLLIIKDMKIDLLIAEPKDLQGILHGFAMYVEMSIQEKIGLFRHNFFSMGICFSSWHDTHLT